MIGILIIAHGTLGESLIHCASHVMGKRPLYLRQLGVTIHDDFELPKGTPGKSNEGPEALGLFLQDHGNPVKFRNIWVRETKPAIGKRTREPFRRDGDKETPIKASK